MIDTTAAGAPPRLAEGPDAVPTGRGRTIALIVILLAFFMDVLDSTIVNVAIPSIQDDLGASYSAIQWIVAGYSLAFALFLITGGRLGDIFGYKPLFLIGIAGFTVASALSGFAPNTETLIAARLAQGVMAAVMVPQILSTIQVMYVASERKTVSVYYGALGGVATVAGPVVGALLIAADVWGYEWRTIFLVNIPVGIVTFVLAAIYMPAAKSSHPLNLDIVGAVIALVAMLMLMYPLIQGRELDWPAWVFVSMALSVVVFGLFAWSQKHKDRLDGSPLVVPQLFENRSFAAGIVISGAFYTIIYGFFLVLTLYLQAGLGYPVLKAGLTGIPFSIAVCFAAALAGPVLTPRFGRAIIVVGPVIFAAGLILMVAITHRYGSATTPWLLIAPLAIAGAGMGFVVAPIYPFVLGQVPVEHAGSASGIVNTVGQIGGAIGIALIGTIFFGHIGDNARQSAVDIRPELQASLAAAGLPPAELPAVMDNFQTCFNDRSSAKDMSRMPPSCRRGPMADAATVNDNVAIALQDTGREANARNFTRALEHTILWEIGAVFLVFLLSFLLPRRPIYRDGEAGVPMI